jgi:hypothetical protein
MLAAAREFLDSRGASVRRPRAADHCDAPGLNGRRAGGRPVGHVDDPRRDRT